MGDERDDRVAGLASSPGGVPGGLWTGPGLVDLQVNGYAGLDFNGDPRAWSVKECLRVRDALRRRGVVVATPTLITDAPDVMIARARRYAELLKDEPALAEIFPKLHVEGPYVSREEGPRGAHPEEHCRAPRDLLDLPERLQEACRGRLGLVTLAPELPGAVEMIGRLAAAGVCVGIGHTMATPGVLAEAVAAGAKWSVHLGNGSHAILPRLDNYVQAQLADDRLAAGFIADGHHMPFTTLKNFIRAKTPTRSILVTDAVSAAELGPGRHNLGNRDVIVTSEGRVAYPGSVYLAGSVLTLDRAVLNVCWNCGVGFEDAWRMASTHPAALIGIRSLPVVEVEITDTGFHRR